MKNFQTLALSAALASLSIAATSATASTECGPSKPAADSPTGVGSDITSACIELRESGTDPVLGLIKRYGSSVRLVSAATYLELNNNGTPNDPDDDYLELKAGADLSSGVTCTKMFISDRFYLSDPNGNTSGCSWVDSIAFDDRRTMDPPDEIDCSNCTPAASPLTGPTSVIVRAVDGELQWDYPGAISIISDCTDDGGVGQLVVDEWCLIRENNGVDGATFRLRVTHNGYTSEQTVAVITTIGITDEECADCPVSPTLGSCVFQDSGSVTCDCVQDVTSADCAAAGGSWTSGGSCTSTYDGCEDTYAIFNLTFDRDEEEAAGELTIEDCAEEGEEIGNAQTTVRESSHAPADPVEHISGHKIEAATDLSMAYPGGTYSFTRQYRSSQTSRDVLGAVGRGWTGGDFMHIAVDTASPVNVTLRSGNSKRVYSDSGSTGKWRTGGPTDQYFEKALYQDGDDFNTADDTLLPVWQLVDPDGRRWLFYREKETADGGDAQDPADRLIGLLFMVLDGRASAQRYDYVSFGGGTGDPTTTAVSRPSRIQFSTIYPDGVGGHLHTVHGDVRFLWNSAMSAPNRGTLRQVSAHRYDSIADNYQLLEYVQYRYANDIGVPYSAWSHLASPGDLIQVSKFTRLDDSPTGDSVFRELITQYRYHLDGDSEDSTAGSDTDNDGVPGDKGEAHQLRMVFTPFEIEHFAEQSGASSLSQAARDLLRLKDGDTAFGTTTVAQLASKVIARYVDDRVKVQFIQASCGCSGISSGPLGIEREYSYWMDDSTVDASDDFTFWYDESVDGSTDCRRFVSHLERHNETGVPLLMAEAIIDPSNDDAWVYKYVYTTTAGELKAKLYPSAIDHANYLPNLGTAAGFVPYHTGQGYVLGYVYNTDSLMTHRYVREGYDPAKTMGTSTSGWHVLEQTIYQGTGRTDLPAAVLRYRTTEEVPSSAADNDIERVDFEYTYYAPSTLDYQVMVGSPVAAITTKVERELSTENGPTGTGTYDSVRVLDVLGRTVFELSADNSLTETEYDSLTGGVAKVSRNILNTAMQWTAPTGGIAVFPVATSNDFTNWGRSDGGSLATEYERDFNGRVIKVTRPGGIKSQTYRTMSNSPWRGTQFNDALLYYSEITLPHVMNAGHTAFNGVATQTWIDAAGSMVEQQEFEISDASAWDNDDEDYRTGAPEIVDTSVMSPASELAGRTATESDFAGKSIELRRWHDVTETAGGPYAESASFDEFGRLESSTDANGTITVYTYDILDRQTKVQTGISTTNLFDITEMAYDNDAIGDSNLTLLRQHVTSASDRETDYKYDDRNRLVWTINALAPHTYVEYDNLNRMIKTHASPVAPSGIEEPTQANRIASSYRYYSQRGLVWRSSREIDPTSAPNTDLLVSDQWFDEVGRTIKSQPPGAPGTKAAYDGLGRVTHTFMGEMLGDSGYTDVYDATNRKSKVNGDVILEESVTTYGTDKDQRGFNHAVLSTTYQRAHTSSSTGSLSNFDAGGGDSTAVATFKGYVYDNANRPVKSGDFGTNQSSGFDAGGTAPTMQAGDNSNDFGATSLFTMPSGALVSESIYDARGRVATTVQPDGTRTRTIFDDMNRSIGIVENDQTSSVATLTWSVADGRWDSTNAGGDTNPDDENRVTSFVYDGLSNITRRVAHDGDTNVQETLYTYAYDGTHIKSNALLSKIEYPDETAGTANTASSTYRVSYEYNAQGELIEMTDQNGTIHAYAYDAMGRLTEDDVTFFGTNIDQTVHTIRYAFSSTTGLLEEVTSLDGAGTPNVLNQIRFEYDDMLAPSKYRQNPSGQVGSGQSADVEYIYTREDGTTNDNFSRLDIMKYPLVNTGGNQRTQLQQHYGSAASLDDKISRSRGFDWTFQMKAVATDEIRYDYLGLGRTVVANHGSSKLQLDYYVDPNYMVYIGSGGGVVDSRTPGDYEGLDQYGRVERQVWISTPSTWDPGVRPAVMDIAFEYETDATDIVRRYDSRFGTSLADIGDKYSYDGLNRLDEVVRGKPNGSLWTPDGTREETWGLDVFGNWDTYANAIGGTSFSQARTHNEANELTINAETISSTTTNLDMEYDAAGNLYRREVSDTVRWVYTWDAWNRLVAVDIEQDTGLGWVFDAPRMKSGYYGLNQRAWSQIDAGAAGYTNNGTPTENLDRLEQFYYDASWRLLERRTDATWSGSGFIHEETTQWVWGQRYIDELIAWADSAKSPTTSFDDTVFAMTDRNFSVIGLNNGERVRYDAYGYALASPDNDVDADGLVGLSDSNAVSASFGSSYGSGSYRVEADVNRDGSVNLADLNAVNGASGDSIDRGDLSESGNIVGHAGYIFEPATGIYLVRNRWYSPAQGRWASRDPLGYVDGQNMLQYCGSLPVYRSDPSGLRLRVQFPENEDLVPASIRNDPRWARFRADFAFEIARLVASLCPAAKFDFHTGEFYWDGGECMAGETCACLKELIENEHDNRIVPLHPSKEGPLYPGPYALPDEFEDAVPMRLHPNEHGPVRPGSGTPGEVVWNPDFYFEEKDRPRDPWRVFPLEASLGHELCGHVLLFNRGTQVRPGNRRSVPDQEVEALEWEDIIRDELGLPRRAPRWYDPSLIRPRIVPNGIWY